MADLNYVSPLTSDLTEYYTKTEVDELQQGDAATYATTAQVDSKDAAVKNWVENQGYLTQHQSLQNYATKEYVDDAIEGIDISGGMTVRVVNVLPAEGEEGIFYLVYESNDEEENRYAEYIWSDTLNGYEMLGYGTGEGVMPDLTNYATKSYVDTAVGAVVVPTDAEDIVFDNTETGLQATNVQTAIDELTNNTFVDLNRKANSADLATVATSGDYDDLSNKPTIPSLTGYATETYVNDAVGAVVVPDISGLATEQYVEEEVGSRVSGVYDALGNLEQSLATVATSGSYNDLSDKPVIPAAPDLSAYATKSELSAKANAADLATVATSGSYNDLSNKPTIPSTSGLASETWVQSQGYLTSHQSLSGYATESWVQEQGYVDEPFVITKAHDEAEAVATAKAIEEINNNVSAAGLSGDYDDLTNKPTLFSGDYNDLSNKPVIPSIPSTYDAEDIAYDNQTTALDGTNVQDAIDALNAGVGAINTNLARVISAQQPIDYDNTTSGLTASTIDGAIDELAASIPSLPTLATVATTGDYDDLTNKPTIPVLPTLATVATSGSYNDLSDKPVIPSGGVSRVFAPMLNTYAFDANGLSNIPTTIYYNSTIANHMNEAKTEFIEKVKNGEWIRFIAAASSGQFILANTDLGLASNISFTIYRYNTNTQTFASSTSTSTNIYTSKVYGYVGEKVLIEYPVDIYEFAGALKLLPYANGTSGLTATTIQGAIDELAAASGSSSGITVQDVIDEFNDNGLTIDNGNDSKIEITNDGVLQTSYDSNENPTFEKGLDGSAQYIYDTNAGTTTRITYYAEPTGLNFALSVLDTNRDEDVFNKEITVQATQTMDELQAVFGDNVEGTSGTKTFAFVEDLPSAVKYVYDSTNKSLLFMGVPEDDM